MDFFHIMLTFLLIFPIITSQLTLDSTKLIQMRKLLLRLLAFTKAYPFKVQSLIFRRKWTVQLFNLSLEKTRFGRALTLVVSGVIIMALPYITHMIA